MVEICSESLRNSAIGDRFHCTEMDVRREFVAALESAQSKGEIPAGVDPEMAVLMLFAVTDGLVLRLGLEDTLTPKAPNLICGGSRRPFSASAFPDEPSGPMNRRGAVRQGADRPIAATPSRT